jgi:hydrophobic/amphiphilic exporter-1 (mainly G- bacteria), HAE1 family
MDDSAAKDNKPVAQLHNCGSAIGVRAVGCGGDQSATAVIENSPPPRQVRIANAVEGKVARTVSATGTLAAEDQVVGGDEEVSRFIDPAVNEEYDLQLRLSQHDREDIGAISRLYVPRAGAGLVRLDNLVQVEPAQSASRIDRLDRQRQVSLRAQIATGYALADRLEALNAAVREMNLPAEYSTVVSGRGRELERTFTQFLWAFLLSIIFMYMILASQYESTIHPLDDSPVVAAVGAVRAAVIVADR